MHSASTAPPPPNPEPQLAADMKEDLLKRHTTASVKVRDLVTGHEYNYRSGARYDSASIVKVAIMAAVLRRQEKQKRYLTRTENRLLHKMIQNSDNDASIEAVEVTGAGTGDDWLLPSGRHETHHPRTRPVLGPDADHRRRRGGPALASSRGKSTLLTKAGRQVTPVD